MIPNEDLRLFINAIRTYGVDKQKWMLVEECGELLNALAKHVRGRSSYEELMTELADVSIMVEQIALFYGWDAFLEERARKIERLKTRLKDN